MHTLLELAEQNGGVTWQRYERGLTALDFGQRYLCASADAKQMGIRLSHEIPGDAAWVVPLADLARTVPAQEPAQ